MFAWEGERAVRVAEGQRFDMSPQVLALSLARSGGPDAPVQPLARLLQAPGSPRPFVPCAVVAHKAKQLDDGLLAAVEVALQRSGAKALRAVLTAIADALEAACPRAAAVADAARQLGGGPAVRESLRAAAAPILERWEKAPEAQPLGFYTWSAELRQVWRQDRFLQQDLVQPTALGLSPADAAALHSFVNSTPPVRDALARRLALQARLTNPPHAPSVLEPLQLAGDRTTRLLPASESPESSLAEQLAGAGVKVCGVDLMAEVVRRVRAGELLLEPGEGSGWYAHCQWALQPLLEPQRAPEAARLRLSNDYAQCLEGLFTALLAGTRESHAKQLHVAKLRRRVGGRPGVVALSPSLSVEPLAEYYLRRSQAYSFVLGVLREHFSAEELAAMHRLREAGPVEQPLAAELEEMVQLFQGLHDVVMHELGFPRPNSNAYAEAVELEARRWLADVASDADLLVDSRAMVPVFHDPQSGLYKVWCAVGFAEGTLQVAYSELPEHMPEESDGSPVRVAAMKDECSYVYPVFVEAQTRRLLGRREFQQLCDAHSRPEEIKDALEALQ
eukprot:m51a1_g3530 hypothetical protein (561) ;mRNA; f:942107-944084